ncbi:glutaredoxin-C11-like [Salvia hispanica]|uniref:glutaredoxin-C11-like n=1 Tax=Salvia hispanica TaxID=49212 RepID=UPI0020093365|nr:glutaredoxin-C11-like [Salvia hispanica]
MEIVRELARKNAAVIFTKSWCCMCHSMKALLYELGASPAVYELDQHVNGAQMERGLRALGCCPVVPVVFIGGALVGSAEDIISLHVDGSLKHMLINAKAIWL